MMRQFYKAKVIIGKEDDEKMVQEEVAQFESEVDNFFNLVRIENEDKEDLKLALALPMEIEKVLQDLIKWLVDLIISQAHELFKRKYKYKDGLQHLVSHFFVKVDRKCFQVVHVDNNNCFCVAGNKITEASVYDSMSGNSSQVMS